MSDLNNAMCILHELQNLGIPCVIAGGAARDIHLGRTPKDYDILLYADPGDAQETICEEFPDAAWCTAFSIYGTGEYTGELGQNESHLEFVVKLECNGTTIDIIKQRCDPQTPDEVLEAFDCTLNMAYLDNAGKPVLHRLFPYPGDKVEMLRTCDLPVERSYYLAEKFPEYVWPYTPTKAAA